MGVKNCSIKEYKRVEFFCDWCRSQFVFFDRIDEIICENCGMIIKFKGECQMSEIEISSTFSK